MQLIDVEIDAVIDPLPPFTFCCPQAIVDQDAARAPCDSKGSECQCGIHRAETASALRSRKTERAAKEKPTQISHFFLAPAAPAAGPQMAFPRLSHARSQLHAQDCEARPVGRSVRPRDWTASRRAPLLLFSARFQEKLKLAVSFEMFQEGRFFLSDY